jgi:hypothetical protein
VQVAPINPNFKAPGTQRLKLKYVGPLSNFAFKSNLRHYIQCGAPPGAAPAHGDQRPHGRAVHVEPMKPELKAPGTNILTPNMMDRF